LLRTERIVLLDPLRLWEDRNDVAGIREYAKRKGVSKVFAVCFAVGDETIHHWKAYANGSSGCCIEFDKDRLLESFPEEAGFRCDDVEYKWVKVMEATGIDTDRLPFAKRMPYQFEHEFRIICEGDTSQKSKNVAIHLEAIKRITISPTMPDDIYASVKQLLKQEVGDIRLEINHSTL
jgi:hypothetical protein